MLLKEKDYLFAVGAANAMQAIILERAGFDFVSMPGSGTAITQLGFLDVGLITETEMVNNARLMARAANIPIKVDGDNGYGNAINVIRTVQDFEAAG